VICLSRGGIFKHDFVANLLPSSSAKKFENRLIFVEVMGKSLVSCFLTHNGHMFGNDQSQKTNTSKRSQEFMYYLCLTWTVSALKTKHYSH